MTHAPPAAAGRDAAEERRPTALPWPAAGLAARLQAWLDKTIGWRFGHFARTNRRGAHLHRACVDGEQPNDKGALALGIDGNFYGKTGWGGANASGTIFKITPTGTLTTLYSLCSQPGCTDGFDDGDPSGVVSGAK